MRLVGKDATWEHICRVCQGKAAKRLFRTYTKRQKQRENRAWRSELE